MTLVEFKTDTRLLELHEVEMWSATTSVTFVNCNESPGFELIVTFVLKLTASNKTPDTPGVFVDIKANCVEGEVAVNP